MRRGPIESDAERMFVALLALGTLFSGFKPRAGAASVIVDGSQTYQTIDGFGVNLNHWNTNEIGPVIDALIDQAGMTLFRVIRDRTDWEATDSNSNPSVTPWAMDWGYYSNVFSAPDFQSQWDMMAYLNQKGITNGISLSFMGLGPPWMLYSSPAYLIPGYEPQWAEMLTAFVLYARNVRHLQFNLVEPNNEPDMPGTLNKIRVTQSQQVIALDDLAQCLDANGLGDIRFVGPDLGDTSFPWMSAWLADPVVMSKVAHMGIHCYNDNIGGPSTGVYSFLQQSAYPNLNFWMTEYNTWCSSCEGGGSGDNSWDFARNTAYYLYTHLANGAAGSMVFTGCDTYMAYLNNGLGAWSWWGLFAVDNIYATPKTFTPRKGFYTLSQFSKYIRPGARRIGVSGDTSPFNLLAFYHPMSGQITLAGVNSSGAAALSGTLASLPSVASMDLYYTSSSTNLCWAGSVPVSNGAFAATIPGNCVFTLVVLPVSPPELAAAATANGVTLTWPGDQAGYKLQSKSDLGAGGQWRPVTNALQTVNGRWTVTVQPLGGSEFYRLLLQP
jgi:O-glycosyl hydrolase